MPELGRTNKRLNTTETHCTNTRNTTRIRATVHARSLKHNKEEPSRNALRVQD
jgi:hypothetical protein